MLATEPHKPKAHPSSAILQLGEPLYSFCFSKSEQVSYNAPWKIILCSALPDAKNFTLVLGQLGTLAELGDTGCHIGSFHSWLPRRSFSPGQIPVLLDGQLWISTAHISYLLCQTAHVSAEPLEAPGWPTSSSAASPGPSHQRARMRPDLARNDKLKWIPELSSPRT